MASAMDPRVLRPGEMVRLSDFHSTKALRDLRFGLTGNEDLPDFVALLVDQDRKVRGDADLIFYNNTGDASSGVVLEGRRNGTEWVRVGLGSVGADVHRIVFGCANGSLESSSRHELTVFLSDLDGSVLATARCVVEPAFRAMTLLEIYRHGGEWRCRLLAEGYDAGLAALVRDHGVDVDDTADQAEKSAEQPPPVEPPTAPPPASVSSPAGRRTPPRNASAHPPGESTIADRCSRLVRFLYDLAQSQTTAIRDVAAYPMTIWLGELPSRFEVNRDAGPGDVILAVPAVALEPPPHLPSELNGWVSLADRDNSSLAAPPLRLTGPLSVVVRSPDGERTTMTTTVPIADAPRVQSAYDSWLPTWQEWAATDRITAAERRVYDQLYTARQRLSQEGDALELVLGVGVLTYETPEATEIRHPLLTTRLQVSVDARAGTIEVGIPDDALTRLEDGALLQGSRNFHAERTNVLHERLRVAESYPFGDEAQQLLADWLQLALGVAEGWSPDWQPHRVIDAAPHVQLSPVIMLRPRGRSALLNYYDAMLRALARDEEAPLGLAQLVETLEPADRIAWLERIDATSGDQLGQDPLFPLPANPEQAQIMGRLRGDNGVVVEGPPGTGKTHTIANLIAALLAQGQRVLVTSQKAQALRVLRDKLPTDLQRMCVSLTDVARGGSPELAGSIAALAAEKSSHNPEARARRIQSARNKREQALAARTRITEEVRALREAETYQHPEIAPGYAGTAATIAARLKRHSHAYDWMPLPVESPMPFAASEALELIALLRSQTPDRVARADQELPDLHELPGAADIKRNVDAERAAQDAATAAATPLSRALGSLGPDEFQALEGAFDALDNAVSTVQPHLGGPDGEWMQRRLTNGFERRDEGLWELLDQAGPHVGEAAQALAYVGLHAVAVPPEVSAERAVPALQQLRAYLAAGGQLKKMFKPDAQKAAEPVLLACTVDAVAPSTAQHVDLLIAHLSAEAAATAAARQWLHVGVSVPAEIGLPARVSRLRDLHRLLGETNAVLAHRAAVAAKLDQLRVRDVSLRGLNDCAALGQALASVRLRLSAEAATTQLDSLAEGLGRRATAHGAPPELGQLAEAMRARDAERYASLLDTFATAHAAKREQRRCNALRDTIRPAHPAFWTLLEQTSTDDAWESRLADLASAWAWGQARTWFDRQREPGREQRLEGELASAETTVAQTTAELATEMAWQHCLGRMNATQVAALQSYRSAIDAKGKGYGKYAERYARAARDAMRDAQGAVPAWIMPLPEVLATIPPERDSFDVVIVDEASQASLESLFLLWLAPRVIVVGDDKQCTPPEVALGSLEPIFARLDDLLPDLPSYLRVAFTPRSSLFSILRARFGQVIRLREHFRCMPEIIEWSSSMFYRDQPLVPLRQFGADRLDPIKVVHVRGAFNEGKSSTLRNQVEAEALVEQVLACAEDPAYANKTFGVVVLQGNAQVDVVRNALMRRMPREEQERRLLRIGTPPDFQGDERHVVFLSMVLAPDTRSTSLTKLEYQRRFNVAASRAQDQVWLFHSVTVDALNPADLRHSYLTYLMARPNGDVDDGLTAVRRDVHAPPFDSLFEQRVFLDIRGRGYRVTPQVEVNGRRIDLVVTGGSSKLAVECDGDAWHSTPEQVEADLARERELKRAGWVFWRVRESEYNLDNDDALSTLWTTLESRGIEPFAAVEPSTPPAEAGQSEEPSVRWSPVALSQEEGLDDLEAEPAA